MRGFHVADEMNPSCRSSMEDSHRVVRSFGGNVGQAFFAVYDGHGGRGIVDYIEHRTSFQARQCRLICM